MDDQNQPVPTDPNAPASGGMPTGDQPMTPPLSTPMDQPVPETPTETPAETPVTPDTGTGGEQPSGGMNP